MTPEELTKEEDMVITGNKVADKNGQPIGELPNPMALEHAEAIAKREGIIVTEEQKEKLVAGAGEFLL